MLRGGGDWFFTKYNWESEYLYTGIRASEIIGLKIGDLVLDEQGGLYEFLIKRKGNKEDRILLSARKVKNEINFFKQNNYKEIARSMNNRQLDRTQIWKMMNIVFKEANINKSGLYIFSIPLLKKFTLKPKTLVLFK